MAAPTTDQQPLDSKPPPIKWPNRREDYELLEVIGSGATAVVQVARCIPNGEKVAIKRIDLEQCGSSIEELQKEISLMSHCHHPNVINYYTSFVVKHELWLVMRLMSGGSLLDIIKHVSAKGVKGGVLDEVVIATVLKEVLLGLDYFHSNGQIHRDMKAGNILLGDDGSVQMADFGVSNWLTNDYQPRLGGKHAHKIMPRNTFVGTPCWMAPEVMDQSIGYNEKADIWSFGITALELATGTAPYAKFPPMKVLMLTLENPPPTLETCGDLNNVDYKKNYSKSFQKMVEKCLQRDPEKRLSSAELLKLPFFKKAKNKEFIKEVVLGDAPSLQSRAKRVKHIAGSSGRLHKNEEGEWEWSDEEYAEPAEDQPSKQSDDHLQPVATSGAQPQNVQPPLHDSAVIQMQAIANEISNLEKQLSLVTQEHKQVLVNQQAQQSAGQLVEARKLLESAQSLERNKQQLQFQHQQLLLKLQQAKEAQAMEQEFQKTMKLQVTEQAPNRSSAPNTSSTIKMVLRKRTDNNQLKDIKFDFIPGSDNADSIAKDLVSARLIDGRNLVVVAANIQKLVENSSVEKLVFKLATGAGNPIDEKKLIGCAQLTVIKDQ